MGLVPEPESILNNFNSSGSWYVTLILLLRILSDSFSVSVSPPPSPPSPIETGESSPFTILGKENKKLEVADDEEDAVLETETGNKLGVVTSPNPVPGPGPEPDSGLDLILGGGLIRFVAGPLIEEEEPGRRSFTTPV